MKERQKNFQKPYSIGKQLFYKLKVSQSLLFHRQGKEKHMKKSVIIFTAGVFLALGGCSSDETPPVSNNVDYAIQYGIVTGVADFATETPNISISNIKTYVGEDIDYSSGVSVENTEKFEDFQMWVDASKVDIYTEGVYEAVYKFIYDGKTMEKTIVVSVVKNSNAADEPSGEIIAGNNQNGNENSNMGGNVSTPGNNADSQTNPTSSSEIKATKPVTDSVIPTVPSIAPTKPQADTTKPQTDTTKPSVSVTTKPVATTKKNETTKKETTTKRQMITSSGIQNTTQYTIGYMNIELLSGSYVKIKCTSSKYIVSTRTDISDIEKKGVKYKAYKLVITYNTGAEQVLETYEEKQ